MLALLAIVCAACVGLEAAGPDNSSLYRLPKDILPVSYDLLLLTNVTAADFHYEGETTIELIVEQRTRRIVLHAEKLRIVEEKARLRRVLEDGSLREIGISGHNYDGETQFYTINVADDLELGRYLLTLHFVGEVLDDVYGFYRSSYRVNGEVRWIGVTQFSPTFARRAFPCMDEPGFKATFQLRIGHYGNETVSSNTFQESRDITNRPNYYITRFSRTPRMSTYLLGWAIHDFARVNSSDPRIWLWTRLDDPQLLRSLTASPALTEGPKIYSALENWMPLANPLGKIEHFAVPDFIFGAMENWGFITFRESVPLVWDDLTPLRTIHDNLVTMGHEYAHTWFGNIVTPEFWNTVWLKEGFATYFAHLAIGIVHEDWRMMDLFAVETLQDSLLDDAAEHNRTMNGRNVGSPASARAAQDFVSYKKGASVIRMISDVVGAKSFKHAMHSYLKERQYEAASPSDINRNLQLAVDSSNQSISIPVSIAEFVDTWANQTNYPLVRASRVGPKQLRLSQEPFQLNRSKIAETNSRFWWIPVEIATSSSTTEGQLSTTSIWLGSNSTDVIVELPENVDWFVLNPRLIGYYRVDYDAGSWEALKTLLGSNDFRRVPAVGRAAILDDVFNLARAGFEKYELALDLARYLRREDEYEPWVAASRAINLLVIKLRDRAEVRQAFRRYAVDLIAPIYKQLSFEERPMDSRIKKMHRNLVLSTACSLNLGDCVSNTKSIFDNWIANEKKPVPANLKSFVYRVGVVDGTDDDWLRLWQRFLNTDLHSEKVPMIAALGRTENSTFVNKYLEFSIQPESELAKQYRLTIVESIVAGSSKNIDTTLNYLEANVNKIIDLRGVAFLEKIFTAIGKSINSVEQENKLTLFVDRNANLLGSALEAGKKAIKSARDSIAWIDTCASQIANYLS